MRCPVVCGDDEHELELDNDGELHMLHHDIEEEEALKVMGLPTSRCFRLLNELERDPEFILIGAAKRNEYHLAMLAIQYGANVRVAGEAAIVFAAKNGNFPLAKALVEKGSNPNTRAWQPIREAIKHKHLTLAEWLSLMGWKRMHEGPHDAHVQNYLQWRRTSNRPTERRWFVPNRP